MGKEMNYNGRSAADCDGILAANLRVLRAETSLMARNNRPSPSDLVEAVQRLAICSRRSGNRWPRTKPGCFQGEGK
jgi:hypothetical protein